MFMACVLPVTAQPLESENYVAEVEETLVLTRVLSIMQPMLGAEEASRA